MQGFPFRELEYYEESVKVNLQTLLDREYPATLTRAERLNPPFIRAAASGKPSLHWYACLAKFTLNKRTLICPKPKN